MFTSSLTSLFCRLGFFLRPLALLTAMILAGPGLLSAQAQETTARNDSPEASSSTDPTAAPSPTPSKELLLAELDKRRPDEASPFFALRERAEFFNTEEGRFVADQNRVAVYPNTAGNDTVTHALKEFTGDLTRSFRFWPEKPSRMTSLKVTPGTLFSLEDRREISATLSVTNHSNRLLSLEFPTTQRFDFVITDESGAEVARWSQDRNFTPEDGVIMVNPQERVDYTATLPTRELEAGRNYTLSATIAEHPDFTHSVTLEPR